MIPTPSLRRIEDLPRPKGLPLLGNALQLDPPRLHLQLEEWAQQLGPFYRIAAAHHPFLIVADMDTIHHVLRDRPDGFSRMRSYEPAAIEMGFNGVFSAEGEPWRRQRRVWMASLNAQQLRGFHLQLVEITQRLLRRWRRAADRGDVLDVGAELMRYTVDVTMRFALGHEANTLEKGEDIIQKHLNQIFPALARRIAAPVPYWRWFKLPMDRALDRALLALRGEVDRLIESARERLRADPALHESPSCFIEALLVARERDPDSLSEQDVFANAVTVLLGGEDTTATTLSWLIHHCCEHPDVYQGLRAEADALLDATPGDEIPRADRFAPYLERTDAAINETLRLNPVAPLYGLTAKRDVVLAGVRVPAGTDLFLLPRAAAGCAPSSQPAPRFDPATTHDETDPAARGPGRAVTLPFGFGPRMCPGRNLALAELRTVPVLLARHFDLEAVPGPAPVRELFSFTLVPQNLRVRLHRRRQPETKT